MLLDLHLNTGSTPVMRRFLYGPPEEGGCAFPRRYIKERGRNTERLATDVGSLLSIYRLTQDRRVELCLLLSDRLTQLELLGWPLDRDGRMRTSLNLAGTEVGRMASNKSNTGSGGNLHTVPQRHRRLFGADPGHEFWSVDLKSADTWTVAAECAGLGDPTMFEDLQADLKQAKIVSLLYLRGAGVNSLPRPELAALCATLPKDWLYSASKRVVHGSNYGMGEVRMAEQILEDSWKGGGQGTSVKLATITPAQCRKLQALYFTRYPGVLRWQERVRAALVRDGYLVAASGLRRDFFGPKQDHTTQKEAYPFCPAANTAHACNMALAKVWADRGAWPGPEAQASAPGPGPSKAQGVQVLLTVHDSVLFQAPVEARAWVLSRLPVWFDNPLTVAGTTFTIPYEAQVGPSWGELHSP